ncbi:hypothetical protein ACHAO4_004555 [Trichoderma viride]
MNVEIDLMPLLVLLFGSSTDWEPRDRGLTNTSAFFESFSPECALMIRLRRVLGYGLRGVAMMDDSGIAC